MIDRRTLLTGFASIMVPAAPMARTKRPCLFWFYTSESEGKRHAPAPSPNFTIASVDIPCHGDDIRPGEPPELAGWRHRMEHGEDLFGKFIIECRTRLDKLIDDGTVDPSLVFVGGVSRGAYAALMLSIADSRFHHVVGLAPLLNLNALTEFESFNTSAPIFDGASALGDRSIFMIIEGGDERVGAHNVIDLAEAIRLIKSNADIEAVLLPGSAHTVTSEMIRSAEKWISDRAIHSR